MIIVKRVLIGNSEEAFIERKLVSKMNLIFSDDNNKGKTIVVQGIMYALGASPGFPKNFEYRDYYFALDLDLNGSAYSIIRQRNSFVVRNENVLQQFDSVSDFRAYWSNCVIDLPTINKDGLTQQVDLSLYAQIAFLPQDDRTTSNVLQGGRYNKDDFKQMIFGIAGASPQQEVLDKRAVLKNEIQTLFNREKKLTKEAKLLQEAIPAVELASPTADRVAIGRKVKRLEELSKRLVNAKSQRNRAYARKTKNSAVLKELMSLNRSIDAGKLVCLDCGSQNICYSSKDRGFVFDITTAEVRGQILDSIQDKILQYEKEISGLDTEIEGYQRQINTFMRDEPVSYTDVIIYNSEYASVADIDNEISGVEEELAEKQAELASISSILTENAQVREKIEGNLIDQMNRFRIKIDGSNSKEYDELFTKHGHPYSGSEETEFLLSRLYAYAEVLNHQYPIIVDSSRAEDLSTPREQAALEAFRYIKNQVIFTTTIKEEEKGKYEDISWINAIDYSRHETYKLLSTKDLAEFQEFIHSFSIVLGF